MCLVQEWSKDRFGSLIVPLFAPANEAQPGARVTKKLSPQNDLPFTGRSSISAGGQVVEWSMAPHSKCGEPARAPWVRIPPCPPEKR